MNSELCDIKNMIFQVMTYVRHLEEDVAAVKQELNELKSSQKSDDWGEKSENRGEKCGLSEAELIRLLTGENVLSALKNALQLNDAKSDVLQNENEIKEKSSNERKTSPTPLLKRKKGRKKKGEEEELSHIRAKPRDYLEVQQYINEYCKENQIAISGLIDGREFFDTLEEKNWRYRGFPVNDWQRTIRGWIDARLRSLRKIQDDRNFQMQLAEKRHQDIMAEKAAGGKRPAKQQSASTTESVDYDAKYAAQAAAYEEMKRGCVGMDQYEQMMKEKGEGFLAWLKK